LFCLVGFFAVVAGVNAIMMTFAVTTFGGVETKSSYQAGVQFLREEIAAEAQQARHWQVSVSLRQDTGGPIEVELTARDAAGQLLPGLEPTVSLTHPTNRRLDRLVMMQAVGKGRFHGSVEPQPGQWDFVVELARDGERLFRSRERVILR
jgi:nitrogen fixation protein FixH